MASSVAMVKREKVEPSFPKCPLCNELLKEPTTISPCLHTFCRNCIYEKLSNRGVNGCPVCETNLACVSPYKLRLKHNKPDIRTNTFPFKRRKIEALEVSLPANMNKQSSFASFVISTPTVSTPIAPIEWHKCSVLSKRKLEDVDYYMFTREFNKHKLDMACRWIQKIVPLELSEELMNIRFPEILKCLIYHFAPIFAYKKASISDQSEEIDEKLAKIKSDHEFKLKEQADYYEAKLKEQAQNYEAKIESLENNLVRKTKELENFLKTTEKKNHSFEMLNLLGKDTTSLLEKQKLKDESRRAGLEEGVRRAVRAVQAVSPYVQWDRIHLSDDTLDVDRSALHRAFYEGIIGSSQLIMARNEDKGLAIIL